jgi:hypothetical protein
LRSYYLPRPLKTRREIQLVAALQANVALRLEAERLVAAYVAPCSTRATIIDELIELFEGPQHREAQRLGAEALGEAGEKDRWHAV